MKVINIDKNQCIGCGSCCGIDQTHFDFLDGRFPSVISNDNLDDQALLDAIDSCPTEAITIIEKAEEACDCGEECNCDDECNCGDDCHCGDGCPCHK
ncbi:MAG: ferredoxin [Bacilli bacterium]|nr:ferredoxin [Bacilli bacterium]